MKKQFILSPILVLLVCFVFCPSIMAQDMEESMPLNRHVGPYAEANLGYTFVWVSGGIAGNDFAEGASAGFGWSIGGGYMFKDWIGAEAGYIQCSPEADVEDDPEIDVGGVYVAARFNIPIKDRFSAIIKVGAMTLTASADDVDEDAYVSAGAPFTCFGVGYALTDKIDLRAQFQGPNILFAGAGVLSGGVAIRF